MTGRRRGSACPPRATTIVQPAAVDRASLCPTGEEHGEQSARSRHQDRARVNVNEAHEVRYWTEKFGVSEEDLIQAVGVVGVSAEAVQRYLDDKASKRPAISLTERAGFITC